MLRKVSHRLVRAKNAYLMVAPGPEALVAGGRIVRIVKRALPVVKAVKKVVIDGQEAEQVIGNALGNRILGNLGRRRFKKWFSVALRRMDHSNFGFRGLSAVNRTWYHSNDKNVLTNRIVRELNVVYHDANKAGKHLDVHFGHLSLVYRISGKPVEKDIKFNSKGELTSESKEKLLEHLRAELKNNSRVPWNHDHAAKNARVSWYPGSPTEGYGAGLTRQVVLRDRMEIFHPDVKSSLHLYAPKINPNQGIYIHRLYPGDGKKAPILIAGNLIPRDQEIFEDRLHLKMIQEEDFEEKFLKKVDKSTTTRKYDGASTYFSSNGQGFKFFSPRVSKVTGHRIEYTYKLSEMADKGDSNKPVGMGELLFWRRTTLGNVWWWMMDGRGPEGLCWKYLSAAGIGGILNSNSVRDTDVFPEVRVYRLDKYFGNKISSLSFHDNRSFQKMMCDALKGGWYVVAKAAPKKRQAWEGLVATDGASINNGVKVKWWQDADDWEVTNVRLGISDKEAINGVVEFKSLESGKIFKLGPGSIGSAEKCLDILRSPNDYIGRVEKVISRNGHEGRAARLVGFHLDKGDG